MAKIKTLIVDDEKEAREGLKLLLEQDPAIELLGLCKNGLEAIQQINQLHPQLVFLDIQMPQINGFEVLQSLPQAQLPNIIFVTAYDQYALKAFEVHALDYLLKPFSDSRFYSSLQHAKQRLGHSQESLRNMLQALSQVQADTSTASSLISDTQAPPSQRLVIKVSGKIYFIPYEEIICVEAEDYYIHVHTEQQSYLVRESLKAMEKRLPQSHFVRIHKSSIVNMDYVVEMEPYFNQEYIFKLQNGKKLKLSRTYREKVLHRIKGWQ